jgi:hypothetical protein
VVSVVILLISLADGNLLACGDKFLVPSRGMRFELTPAVRQQAAVLLYANPTTSLPSLVEKLSVDPALRKAGYRPTVVATAEEFDLTLRRASWNVVLLDVADGGAGPLSAAPGSPALIAVATNASEQDVAVAKKQCAAILKSPRQSQAFVQALDAAVTTHQKRAKIAKAAC